MENETTYVVTEDKTKLPVLIVDKRGFIGERIARILRQDFLVVFVTAAEIESHENVIHIPYHKKVPVIPENIYSHFYIVYNGESEMLDMLSSFVGKAEESKTKMLFISSIASSSRKLFKQLVRYQSPYVQIFLYGETFDARNNETNPVTEILREFKIYGRIELPNSGLDYLYPIHIDDVITALIERAFTEDKTFRLFYLFPTHPVSQIAFARFLQKHNPLIKIDFKRHKQNKTNYYIPSGGTFLFSNYNLDGRLGKLEFKHTQTIPNINSQKKRSKIHDPEAQKRRYSILATLFLSLFIAPIAVTFLLALSAVGFLSLSVKQAEIGNIAFARQMANAAEYTFAATETLIPGLVLPNVLLPHQTDQFRQNVKTGKEVVILEDDALSAVQLLKDIYEKKSDNPKDDFLQSTATIKNVLITFQKMKAEHKLPKTIESKMQQYTGLLQLAEGTIDIWPELFGFEGKKQYMILFQNNMELRPGGGFIGSYGIVSVLNGELSKVEVYDVYDADGKLKNHIEPPYGLKRYLGASHWYLRDSNFDIDFEKNAAQARSFLKLETGQNIDGVIGIDTAFIKSLLAVVGGVTVRDYNESVTADNFYLITQSHAEKDFFPGSTQKKDFLRSLMNSLIERYTDKQSFSYGSLSLAVENAIREKHLMLASSDIAQQNIFTVNGLSSSLVDKRTKEKNTFLDFLSVVDANVGANKANYYINRSIQHEIRIDDAGGLQAALDIQYKNNSTKQSAFGGDYKNFLQLFLPKDSILQSVFIDGVEQIVTPSLSVQDISVSNAIPLAPNLEIEMTQLPNNNVYGFYFIVPAGISKVITVTYRIADIITMDEASFQYKLRLFKQPGTIADPYSLRFSYPSNFKIVETEKNIVDLGGKFTYEENLNSDKYVNVTFSKK